MSGNNLFETTRKVRKELVWMFYPAIESNMKAIQIKIDKEIEEELRERMAATIFNEMVNDMPTVPYFAVWEDGADDIFHAYMSPKIETICQYTPGELMKIGYGRIVKGDIISYYREKSSVQENVSPISKAREKRISGFLENRNWEGCYKVEKKDGALVWIIDRSIITRFRNTLSGNILCLSGGTLLEASELFEKRQIG